MSDYMGIQVEAQELMGAFARLKQIPLAKVVRNAARDFAQAAQKATPNAAISRSPWYLATRYEQTQETYQTKRGKTKTRTVWANGSDGRRVKRGNSWFIHESKIGSGRAYWRKGGIEVRKMRVYRGWSKASWIGIMKALGMSHGGVKPQLEKADNLSSVVLRDNPVNVAAEMTDRIAFDKFGKGGADYTSEDIKQRGFELAAWRLSQAFEQEARKQWHP